MALLGCDVVATDQKEVLPLLKRNVERNTSRISQMSPASGVDEIFNFLMSCLFSIMFFSSFFFSLKKS